ncbi:MAG: hypothetical protein L3J59_12195 [Methylococcaceae bacterium]|nr:hypothetical protein [Methylococcaceae bacterium]
MSKKDALVGFLGFVCLAVASTFISYFNIVSTWKQIEMNAEVVKYSEGSGYGFAMIFGPFFYMTLFSRFKKYQKIAFYIFAISGFSSIFIIPHVIDYITEERLIAKGYTYCEAERAGSVRHIKRTWQLDPVCKKKKKSLFY